MFVQWLLLDRYLIEFNSQSFFFFLLPPIVFASAYTLKKKNFVRHISYILGLGVLGTIVAMTVLTLILNYGNELYRDPVTGESWVDPAECMLLAAVLASTDTVAVLTLITADKYLVLNAVLFGEGVVNDAVTILLYQAVDREIQKAEVATNHGIEDGAPGHKDITLGRKEISGMIINFFSLSIRSIIMGALVGLLVSYVLKVFNLNYDPIYSPSKPPSRVLSPCSHAVFSWPITHTGTSAKKQESALKWLFAQSQTAIKVSSTSTWASQPSQLRWNTST
jgi:NhaP-type Na+/H+ or K+/H+ antiporter